MKYVEMGNHRNLLNFIAKHEDLGKEFRDNKELKDDIDELFGVDTQVSLSANNGHLVGWVLPGNSDLNVKQCAEKLDMMKMKWGNLNCPEFKFAIS